MFINIGNTFVRSGDVARIQVKPAAVILYDGKTLKCPEGAEKIANKINEIEKDSLGSSMLAARISAPACKE